MQETKGTSESDSKALKPTDVQLVVAHGPCSDGMMAAAIARYWAQTNGRDIAILFANHPLDVDTIAAAVRGRRVLFVDITPGSRASTQAMIQASSSLFILDHHKTAMDELVGPKKSNVQTSDLHSLELRG
jgi:hypothetical protein